MSTFNLYNPAKKGTLILAGPRYGSHYLAQVVLDWLPVELKPVQGIGGHSEIGLTEQRFYGVFDEIDNLKEQTGYQVAIVNDQSAKMCMIACPELFRDWHIVRIIHNDKLHWFKSYWYFLINKDPGFAHHGTSAEVYKQHLDQYGPYTITPTQLMNTGWNLGQLLTNQYISCDEHIEYQELLNLDTNIAWKHNGYPDVELSQLFANSDVIEKLLTNWPKEIPSAIRE